MQFRSLSLRNLMLKAFLSAMALGTISPGARAQIINPPQDPPGVWMDADGTVRSRQLDEKQELNKLKSKYKTAVEKKGAAKDEGDLAFVSLPKLIDQVIALQAAGKPVPDALRVLGGMTRIQYVFLYPEEHDLIIAGPAEPWARVNQVEVRGIKSGRAVVQLDDLVVAMRDAYRGQKLFGCRIDPDPTSQQKAADVATKYAAASRKERIEALRAALPPQKVSVFGTADNTRLAYVMIAADYKMKRLAMGMDKPPVAGLGNAVDNSRPAMDRFWFEPSYKPLLVSKDGTAYELRGDRLMLGAGAFAFADKPQTEHATKWAQTFTQKLPALAELVPCFSDLQNIADCAVLTTLMKRDGIDRKIGWDMRPVLSNDAYKVEEIPTVKTAETVVGFTSGSLVAGGVELNVMRYVSPDARQPDDKSELNAPQDQGRQLQAQNLSTAPKAILMTPGAAEPVAGKG